MTDSPYAQPQVVAAPPSNTLGLTGFVLSLVGIVTCGLTFPIGLVVSVLGLRREPRGLAIAGTIIGALGTLVLIAAIAALVWFGYRAGELGGAMAKGFQNRQAFNEAVMAIDAGRAGGQAVPGDVEGGAIAGRFSDAWGQPLRYERLGAEEYRLISPGPDEQLGTADDIRWTGTEVLFGFERLGDEDAGEAGPGLPE